MRDIKRIKPFMEELTRVWETVPDWRFGQFIVNTIGSMPKDPFFPEDEEMISFIKGCFKKDCFRGDLAPNASKSRELEE